MRVHLVGFGSQGAAWAECLRASNCDVDVFLGNLSGPSAARAREKGFTVRPTAGIPAALKADQTDSGPHALIALLVPDHIISALYREFVAQVARPVTVVLAHGYAVYAGELTKLAPDHEAALLAPKSIGPKLLAAFQAHRPKPHGLAAAIHASPRREPELMALATALGFSPDRLIPATFEQEAVGDLISEQALLCGGVFNLIEWTMKAMREAGVPAALIREECLTELELIAGLVRERGAGATLGAISQAAQCGTIAMRHALEKAGVPEVVAARAKTVLSREFVTEMRRPEWREELSALSARLTALEKNP